MSAIILCNIKIFIYKIANHKFPNEYSDVIFIEIDQHLKLLLKKYKGSRFYKTRCIYANVSHEPELL